MARARPAILVLFALALLVPGCGSDDPSSASGPTSGSISGSTSGPTSGPTSGTDPPWGLESVEMPNDATAVQELLAALPQELAGLERSDVSPTQVSYGDGTTFVRAIDLAEAGSEGFPDTAPGYLDLLAASGEVDVEAQVTDPDAALVYLVSTNAVQDAPDADVRTTYDAAWGDPDGAWLFVSSATSPEQREALASAFATAAGSS